MRLFWLVSGLCLGIATTVVSVLICLMFLPHWLVVDNIPGKADAAIVLGGGGGSRLRKAIEIYDQDLIPEMILVGEEQEDWLHIFKNLCGGCGLEEKQVTILNGSKNTVTDAELALAYCREQGVSRIIVVTDPYHSRRAKFIFDKAFLPTDIEVNVVNSGDYSGRLAPHAAWWNDKKSLETIWLEFGKIVYLKLAPLLTWKLS